MERLELYTIEFPKLILHMFAGLKSRSERDVQKRDVYGPIF